MIFAALGIAGVCVRLLTKGKYVESLHEVLLAFDFSSLAPSRWFRLCTCILFSSQASRIFSVLWRVWCKHRRSVRVQDLTVSFASTHTMTFHLPKKPNPRFLRPAPRIHASSCASSADFCFVFCHRKRDWDEGGTFLMVQTIKFYCVLHAVNPRGVEKDQRRHDPPRATLVRK